MILCGVPIKVVRPPISDANAKGIRIFDVDKPDLRHRSITTGNKSATTAILFITADSSAATAIVRRIKLFSLLPAKRAIRSPTNFATPVLVSPALRINIAQMVITAGLLKPEIASVGVSKPVKTRLTSTINATRSTRTHSVINSTMAPARMPMRINISEVIKVSECGVQPRTHDRTGISSIVAAIPNLGLAALIVILPQ